MKIKMAMSDAQIRDMRFVQWKSRKMSLDVPDEIINKYNIEDPETINNHRIDWQLDPTLQFGDVGVLRPQDQAVLDIIKSNVWERPIYWAATTADDSKLGLHEYLQMEGLAFRLIPKKTSIGDENVNYDVMWKQLMTRT